MRSRRWCAGLGLALVSLVTAASGAQQSASARIPIRQLSGIEAVTIDTLRGVNGLQHLSDGRVVVNDALRRRLVILDQSLRVATVVADSSGKPVAYPASNFQAPLFNYRGDTSLLLDWTSQALLLVEPSGKFGRVIALPNARDMGLLIGASSGAFDTRGRLLYRTAGTPPFAARPGAPPPSPRSRDTVAIVRADFDSRTVDTLARISIPYVARPVITRLDGGGSSATMTLNPLPIPGDEWVVTSDGSLAIVRPVDYHVDWTLVDGTRVSTPKMPFDWRPLSDADKQARIDSVKHLIDSLRQNGGRPPNMIVSTQIGTGSASRRMDTTYATVSFVPLSEMPDFFPPFRPYTIKADRDNNVWIPPSTTLNQQASGFIYDVINRKGEIFERVAIPGGRIVAGFGPGGVVYLLSGNRETGFVLERRRIIRTGT